MENVVAFDTHRFVERLTANGFTERQAEALADEQRDLLRNNLAAKADVVALEAGIERTHERIARIDERIEGLRSDTTRQIEHLRSDTTRQIAVLQSDTAKRIAELKADLQQWIVTVLMTVGGVGAALVLLLSLF